MRELAWPTRTAAWIAVGFLVLPFLIVIPVSLTDRAYLSMPEHALSLNHYRDLIADQDWRAAFGRSCFVAMVTTVLSVTIGSMCAFGAWRLPPKAENSIRLFMLLPLIVPGIVQGLAFYRTWVDLRLINTYPGIIIAHTVTAMPFVFIAVSAALANVDPRLEMASRSLGAGNRQTLWWVLVPMVLPGILSGALFAFVHSFDELIIVLFITTLGIDTLPKMMWNSIEHDVTPAVACVAVLLGILTFVLLSLEWFLRLMAEREQATQAEGDAGRGPAAHVASPLRTSKV
jgi:putative spermidine/putrescine transport system permease protein